MSTAATLVEASKVWAERKTIAMNRNSSVEEHVMKMNTLNAKLDHLLRPEVMAVDICPVFILAQNTNPVILSNQSMQASGLFVIHNADVQQVVPFADYKIELMYNRPLYRGAEQRAKGPDKTDTFIYQGKTYGSKDYYERHIDDYRLLGKPPVILIQKAIRLIPKAVPVEKIRAALSDALIGFDVIIEPMLGDSVLYELSQGAILVPVPVTEFRIHFMSVKGF